LIPISRLSFHPGFPARGWRDARAGGGEEHAPRRRSGRARAREFWRARRDRMAVRAPTATTRSERSRAAGTKSGEKTARRGRLASKRRFTSGGEEHEQRGEARLCACTGVWRARRDRAVARTWPRRAFGAYARGTEAGEVGTRGSMRSAASRAAPSSLAAKPGRCAGSVPAPLSRPRQRAPPPHGAGSASVGAKSTSSVGKVPCTCATRSLAARTRS
jgi:hypothetical protein